MNHHQHGWQCNQDRNCPDYDGYKEAQRKIAEHRSAVERIGRVCDYCILGLIAVFCVLVISGVI